MIECLLQYTNILKKEDMIAIIKYLKGCHEESINLIFCVPEVGQVIQKQISDIMKELSEN